MKVTLDLPENEVHEIIKFTGNPKKGPAIRRWVSDALALRRRSEMTLHYLHGKWSAELSGYESSRQADRHEDDLKTDVIFNATTPDWEWSNFDDAVIYETGDYRFGHDTVDGHSRVKKICIPEGCQPVRCCHPSGMKRACGRVLLWSRGNCPSNIHF